MSENHSDMPIGAGKRTFASTQWSIVLAARDVDEQDRRVALTQLCENYWYPMYAYIRRTAEVNDARDLTQAFFFHLLEKEVIARADRDRGRFRDFLLTALKNFLTNHRRGTRAAKRGGGKVMLSLNFDAGETRYQIEPSHALTAEMLYERRWVLTLLEQVLQRLQVELVDAGKSEVFDQFKGALTGEATADNYAQAGAVLNITPAAAKQAAYRMRRRYRHLFRQEIARTLANEADVDEEIGCLLEILAE